MGAPWVLGFTAITDIPLRVLVTSLKVTVFQVVDMVRLQLLDVHNISTTYWCCGHGQAETVKCSPHLNNILTAHGWSGLSSNLTLGAQQ